MIVRIPPLSMRFTFINCKEGGEEHFDLVLPALELDRDVAKEVAARINSRDFPGALKRERYICWAVQVRKFGYCMEDALETATLFNWVHDRVHVREGFDLDTELYPERLTWAKHIAKHIGIHFQSFPHSADIPKE